MKVIRSDEYKRRLPKAQNEEILTDFLMLVSLLVAILILIWIMMNPVTKLCNWIADYNVVLGVLSMLVLGGAIFLAMILTPVFIFYYGKMV